YVVDPEPTEQLVSSVLAGSLPPQRAGGPVRVLVQNGVGTPGLGEQARGLLVEEGFTYVNGGNANRFGYRTSVVLIRDASAAARTQGAEVAAALGLPESDLRVAAQGQSVADVVVILGADFAP
nr:LytR C-terminal domain-containing protein [Actinomycetes bacterium]